MRVWKLLPVIAALAAIGGADESCSGEINTESFGANAHMLILRKEEEQMVLGVSNIHMQAGGSQERTIRLGSYEHASFRVFSVTEDMVAVIRCQEDKERSVQCGIKLFHFGYLKSFGKDYDFLSWAFTYVTEAVNYLTDVDKFIFIRTDNSGKSFSIYTGYGRKFNFNVDTSNGFVSSAKEVATDVIDWKKIAGCFDNGYRCMVDYSPYYSGLDGNQHIRLFEQVRRIEDDSSTIAIFHRSRFFKTTTGFFYDNFKQPTCYSNSAKGILVVPHFRATDALKWNVYTEMQDRFQNKDTRACPGIENVNTVLNAKMEKSEEDYDDNGNQLTHASIYRHQCRATGQIMFYVLIASSIFAVVITVLLFGACIVVFIAKKRMRAMGKRMPKKPWETEATGDATTFMDQTMGVSTMTTMGGDTSAYTTVGA